MEILQNNLCYIIKEITKNKPPTIHICLDINESVCIIYRKLPVHMANEKVGRKVRGYHVMTT